LAKHIAFTDGSDEPTRKKIARAERLAQGLIFDEKKYEYSDAFVPGDPDDPMSVHTVSEMLECLKRNPQVDIEARVLGTSRNGRHLVRLNKEQILESSKRRDSKKFRESIDTFLFDDHPVTTNRVGDDFIPLTGGPFFKQLYYRDYLRMHGASFQAYHQDCFARAVVEITSNFTLGRGYDLISENPKAMALWQAFEKVNNLEEQMELLSTEVCIYGEVMIWKLPNLNTKIVYRPRPDEKIPVGMIPRVRLIDPSAIVEIVTHPEDISRVLFYQWLAPTQYQIYTDGKQPSTKFIFQQIPADQVDHYRVNRVSNEKRGRSDFFPALGYMKRLRDSVNYSVVALQKAAAWCIDTTIAGDDQDITDYINGQRALGTFAPAGSEFVHTESVKREYLSNGATGKGGDPHVFLWCLSEISAGTGIPITYFGSHLSGGQNRASALTATEPVVKKFERRQGLYARVVKGLFYWLMEQYGIDAQCDIIFPELTTQDRSAKLKDLQLAEMAKWFSHKRAMGLAAQELDQDDFNPDTEMADIEAEAAKGEGPVGFPSTGPLSTPGQLPPKSDLGMTSDEKTNTKANINNG